MKAKCTKCDYEWITKSLLISVSCPSCGTKVKVREHLGGTSKEVKEAF